MNFFMMSPELNYASFRFGPRTRPGLIVTTSNFSSVGKFLTKSHAAFSAKVLLFSYGLAMVVSLQSSTEKFYLFSS